ncbi:MAG: TonB-dependent receptor [Steroidobacteraceae bacterium]
MKYSRSAVAVAVAAALSSAAVAQQADESVLEEIIVTAQKRESSLQDVPFSVAAMTNENIRASGATNVVELARNVAGLSIADLGPGQSQVAIRGISAGQVIRDQPGVKEQVGIYLDESPISVALFTPDLDLFDLERFEVLRGPQGTLFGAGSTSGTLRYITAQPRLGEFEGTAEFTANEGTDSDFGGSIKGAFNVPIGDTAALRVVGYYNELAGFIDGVYPGRALNEDVNGGDKTGARIALLVQPNDNLSITPRIVYQKLDTDGYPRNDAYNILGNPFTTTEPPVNPGERGQVIQLEEGLEDDFTLADLKIEFDFGGATLTSVSSYTDREVLVLRDASQLTGSVTWDIGGTAAEVRLNSPLFDLTELQAVSQELRVSSNGEGAFQWLIGAFYQDVDREYGQNLPTPGYDAITRRLFNTDSAANGAPPDTPFFSDLTYDFQQFAVFGEGTYRFSEQWSLTAGARFYDFEEDRLLTFAGFFAVPQVNVPGATSSDGVSPRAILTFDASEDVSFSVQIARGFRLGGINDPLNAPICSAADRATFGSIFQTEWEDEKVWNYELGAKTRLADGRVTFNVAAFLSDIEDLQGNVDAGSCSSRIVVNVPEAHSLGAEVELFARPNENWDFGISASWVEAELDSTVVAVGAPLGVAGLVEGNRLPTAPEFQAAAFIGYTQPWSESRDWFVNFTAQHVGSSFSQFSDQVPGFGTVSGGSFITFGNPTISSISVNPELPSYEIGNLRVGVRSDEWELAAFVNNVWDERALLATDRERGTRARIGFLTNQPRTYGVNLRFNF